jgi:hypothetical protein
MVGAEDMPTFGRDETVIGASYPAMEQPGSWQFSHPMDRIDVHVFDDDVFMQVAETDPPTYGDPNTELRLYKGFNSIPLLAPAYGVRFRAVESATRITVHAFAYPT